MYRTFFLPQRYVFFFSSLKNVVPTLYIRGVSRLGKKISWWNSEDQILMSTRENCTTICQVSDSSQLLGYICSKNRALWIPARGEDEEKKSAEEAQVLKEHIVEALSFTFTFLLFFTVDEHAASRLIWGIVWTLGYKDGRACTVFSNNPLRIPWG